MHCSDWNFNNPNNLHQSPAQPHSPNFVLFHSILMKLFPNPNLISPKSSTTLKQVSEFDLFTLDDTDSAFQNITRLTYFQNYYMSDSD
ncbi:hypothetical protein ACS0TY_017173 [Phlomoides rotata]